MVRKFIDYVLADEALKTNVEGILKNFDDMSFKSKMKSLEDLLYEMFKSDTAEDKNENEPPKKKDQKRN